MTRSSPLGASSGSIPTRTSDPKRVVRCLISSFIFTSVKVKKGETLMEGGVRYLEVKQLLLLSYCQAITFYLLLKSEGQPIRDHPVLARLVEIKSLLDKVFQSLSKDQIMFYLPIKKFSTINSFLFHHKILIFMNVV